MGSVSISLTNMKNFSEEIEKSVDLLLKANKNSSEKKKLLEKSKTVYLQVVLFKIPFGAPRKRKFLELRHSLYGDDPEICLFVPNRKTGVTYKKTTDELIDFCVDYYTDLLEKHKVKGIKTIMPLKQLKSEYGTYDLRRKLVHRFDLFLCKNSLLYNSRFLSSLGKIFKVANKDPLGVAFPKEDVDFDPEFQKNIKRAIFTSSFFISRFSDNYSIPIGSLSNTKSELKENLETVLKQLFTKEIIPGGLKNVRAMNLWPSQSKPVPFYINTELPVGLKTPRMKSKNRKRLRCAEGEISTQPHKKVFVMQNGEVFVTKMDEKLKEEIKVSDSESEDSFVDESEDEEVEEEKKQTFKGKNKEVKEENESESEDDEEIEKQEARLLKGKMLNDEDFQASRKLEEEEEGDEEEEEDEKKTSRLNASREKKGKKNKSIEKSCLKKEKLLKAQQSKRNKAKR